MGTPAWYVDEIAAVAERLRTRAPRDAVLNDAANDVDQLGRRLYGFGHEGADAVAAAFTAARGVLLDARGGDPQALGRAVETALAHLHDAARHAGAQPQREAAG